MTNRCVDDRYHLSMPNRAGYDPSHFTGSNGYFNDGGHTTTNRCMDDRAPMSMTDRWAGDQLAPIVGLYTSCPNPMTVPCRPRNELDMPGMDGHRPYTDDSPSICAIALTDGCMAPIHVQ